MSKLKVDTVESSNQNIKLTPNGSGIVEVKAAGSEDGTLKLTSSDGTNGVTLKSPPHSAQQSQTLILPDNSPTQDDFLKVKSVTGSTPDKVAQLEYASIPTPDLTQLDASNITSGTLDTARFPTSIPATSAGLKLVSAYKVPSGGSVSQVDITNLEDDSVYLIIFDGPSLTNSSSNGMLVKWLTSDNVTPYTDVSHLMYSHYWTTYNYTGGSNWLELFVNQSAERFAYVLTVSTKADQAWMQTQGFATGRTGNHGETFASFNNATNRIYGLRITGNSWGGINSNAKFYTYKYLES